MELVDDVQFPLVMVLIDPNVHWYVYVTVAAAVVFRF